jgi:hypothetical protein
LLVAIDDHSRFPVVEFVHSTSAKSTIPKLDVFAFWYSGGIENGQWTSIPICRFRKHLLNILDSDTENSLLYGPKRTLDITIWHLQ